MCCSRDSKITKQPERMLFAWSKLTGLQVQAGLGWEVVRRLASHPCLAARRGEVRAGGDDARGVMCSVNPLLSKLHAEIYALAKAPKASELMQAVLDLNKAIEGSGLELMQSGRLRSRVWSKDGASAFVEE